MAKEIIEAFHEYFEIVAASSAELKTEVYKLRYQVYCLETGFENPGDFSDKMEWDCYDERSIHYLIRHRKSGDYAATARLILPSNQQPISQFPIEINCIIDDNVEILQNINPHQIAEASRVCISRAFKKRKHEANTLAAITSCTGDYFSSDERRTFPHIILALSSALIKASYENDIRYWYAVMEPAALRFYKTLGMDFIKIGPVADYHGERWPCAIKVDDLLNGIAKKNQNLWNLFTNNGAFSSME